MSSGLMATSFLSRLGKVLRTIATVIATDTESDPRPQLEGSDLFGDYNFRTERPDCGIDATGWYEDDD